MVLPGVWLELPEEGECCQASQIKCNVNLLCPINWLSLQKLKRNRFYQPLYFFGFEKSPAGFVEWDWTVMSGTEWATQNGASSEGREGIQCPMKHLLHGRCCYQWGLKANFLK